MRGDPVGENGIRHGDSPHGALPFGAFPPEFGGEEPCAEFFFLDLRLEGREKLLPAIGSAHYFPQGFPQLWKARAADISTILDLAGERS